MSEMQRIFAAIDFSPSSDEALRQAASRAAAVRGKLAVCHIVPDELRNNLLFPQFSKREAVAVPAEVERASEAVLNRVGEIIGEAAPMSRSLQTTERHTPKYSGARRHGTPISSLWEATE